MTERPYTVREIDALRSVVEYKWLFGTYNYSFENGCSISYKEHEKEVAVEQRVRTHMLAGHTAEDLLASEPKAPSEPPLPTLTLDELGSQ